MSPKNMAVRADHILVGFLKAMFGQDQLYTNLTQNEFKFVDNEEENTLIIEMTEVWGQDTPDATPSIIVQDHGYNEEWRTHGHRLTNNLTGTEWKLTNMRHPYTLHCLARRRGSAKILQAATAKSLMAFRKLIYQMGVEHLRPVQARSIQPLSTPDDTPSMHDGAVSIEMQMRQNWFLKRDGEPEEVIAASFREGIDYLINFDGTLDDTAYEQAVDIDRTS